MKNYLNYMICVIVIALSSLSIKAYSQTVPLNIGDVLSNAQINDLLSKSVSTRKSLNNAHKAVLLDFWATYCGPCIKDFPYLDNIQYNFASDLDIISITEEPKVATKDVLDRIFKNANANVNLNIVTDDQNFSRIFPHSSIPHFVWIDSSGVIIAITEVDEVTHNNVGRLISGRKLSLKNKSKTIRYDDRLPMYASKQATLGDELAYHSIVTKYRADINPISARGKNFISIMNSPVVRLFQLAFGKFDLEFLDINRLVLNGISNPLDSANLGVWRSDEAFAIWSTGIAKNAYSYELYAPEGLDIDYDLFAMMQQDLNRYFSFYGLTGKLENRQTEVLSLIEIGKGIPYRTTSLKAKHFAYNNYLKVQNEPISFLLSQLTPYINNGQMILANDTGYLGNIDIEIEAKLSDISSVNDSLKKYGLCLVKKNILLPVTVITQVPK